MKKIFLITIILALILPVFCQEKSTKRAVLLSALVPGMGEYYTGNHTRTGVFLAAEIGILFSYFKVNQELDNTKNSYKQYANTYADVSLSSSDEFYDLIDNYESSNKFNSNVKLIARNYYIIYNLDEEGYEEYLSENLLTDEQSFSWQSTSKWLHYKQIRDNEEELEIYAKMLFGAALINRLVSMVDAAYCVKKHNRALNKHGRLYLNPDLKKKGMNLCYEYKF